MRRRHRKAAPDTRRFRLYLRQLSKGCARLRPIVLRRVDFSEKFQSLAIARIELQRCAPFGFGSSALSHLELSPSGLDVLTNRS